MIIMSLPKTDSIKCTDAGSKNRLGVRRHHPLVSLQIEMDMLSVKWEALGRRIEFWVQVRRMNNDRLVKVVMLEALEIGSEVRWVKDLKQSLEKLGWRGLNVVALDGLKVKG